MERSGRKDVEASAGKMHDNVAGLRVMPADRDVLRRQRDDLAGDAILP